LATLPFGNFLSTFNGFLAAFAVLAACPQAANILALPGESMS
jgi:hypothetical protein